MITGEARQRGCGQGETEGRDGDTGQWAGGPVLLVLHACMHVVRCARCAVALVCPWCALVRRGLGPGEGRASSLSRQTCRTAQGATIPCMGGPCQRPAVIGRGGYAVPGWETRCQPASLPAWAPSSAAQRTSQAPGNRGRGRGAWKFVSMHPRAWADADPQLQGCDLGGRCPGLGPPAWVMMTCHPQPVPPQT